MAGCQPQGLPPSHLGLEFGNLGQQWTPVWGLGPESVVADIFTQNLQETHVTWCPTTQRLKKYIYFFLTEKVSQPSWL